MPAPVTPWALDQIGEEEARWRRWQHYLASEEEHPATALIDALRARIAQLEAREQRLQTKMDTAMRMQIPTRELVRTLREILAEAAHGSADKEE